MTIDCTENSYKNVDEVISFLSEYFQDKDLEVETIKLKDLRISRCTECRVCTQKKGCDPVKCFLNDEMNQIIDEIESADAYIFITDTQSIFKKNKLFQKFSKRLVAYYYWPYGQVQSMPRKIKVSKKSILINYNSSYFKNFSFETNQEEINQSSNAIGAQMVDSIILDSNSSGKSFFQRYKDTFSNFKQKLTKRV